MKEANQKVLSFFSALSDRTRLKIILALSEGPKTVGSIHKEFGKELTLSAISHQLRQLQDLDIILFKRQGREKFFALSDSFCWCILDDAFRHYRKRCRKCMHTKSNIPPAKEFIV